MQCVDKIKRHRQALCTETGFGHAVPGWNGSWYNGSDWLFNIFQRRLFSTEMEILSLTILFCIKKKKRLPHSLHQLMFLLVSSWTYVYFLLHCGECIFVFLTLVLGSCHSTSFFLGHDLCVCTIRKLCCLWWLRQHLLHLQPENTWGECTCEPWACWTHRWWPTSYYFCFLVCHVNS